MIPALAIADWANTVRWPNPDQLEQDLTLARLIVEIANDPYLGHELIFRGGTCNAVTRLVPSSGLSLTSVVKLELSCKTWIRGRTRTHPMLAHDHQYWSVATTK
jgi:hypothetical protein